MVVFFDTYITWDPPYLILDPDRGDWSSPCRPRSGDLPTPALEETKGSDRFGDENGGFRCILFIECSSNEGNRPNVPPNLRRTHPQGND